MDLHLGRLLLAGERHLLADGELDLVGAFRPEIGEDPALGRFDSEAVAEEIDDGSFDW